MSKPYDGLSELQLRLLLVLKDMQVDGAALLPCAKDLCRRLDSREWAVHNALYTLKQRGFVSQQPNGLRAEVAR